MTRDELNSLGKKRRQSGNQVPEYRIRGEIYL